MARFTLPRDLYHGKGALEALKTFEGKRGNDLCWRRLHEAVRISWIRAEQYLKEAGMEVQLFEGIEPDPSVETVMKGAAAMDGVRAGLDRCDGRRFPDRCCQSDVDQIRVPGHHVRGYVQGIRHPGA